MRIAQIAPLQLAVPPANYGGTERVIHHLTEALVELGHDITLFATADAKTSAKLVPMRETGINFDPSVDAVAAHLAILAEIYRQADQFDVIHSHLDYLTLPFTLGATTPTVITLHGRLDRPEFTQVFKTFPDANYVAISDSQRSQVPELNWVSTIHHAVDLRRFAFYPRPGSYLAFVGRMSPEKRPDRAIKIARMTGIPLIIAAKIDSVERPYFEREIQPLLDEHKDLVTFVGTLDEERKNELLGNALALLLPIDWPEPFGMVFIESLALGTPVITCPCGSVPELLMDGVTGYVRKTDEELAEVVSKVAGISRVGCRAYVGHKFDIRAMGMEYVNAYSMAQRLRPPFRTVDVPVQVIA